MKKYIHQIIRIIFIILMFCSCGNPFQPSIDKQAKEINFIYLKEPTTNLCFSVVVYGGWIHENKMTCVPCDSLKNVKVYDIAPTNHK